MPTIVQTQQGIVSGLWGGTALIRGSDGVMRTLKMGDVVRKGDVILTTQDGIVRLTQDGDVAAPSVAQRVLGSETDRVIAALEQNQPDAATAAGLAGGAADGSNLGEGLRVDRVSESTGAPSTTSASGQEGSNNAAVSNLSPQKNTPPSASTGNATGNEDATLPISLVGTDSDGSVVSVRIISIPTGGTLLSNGVPVSAGSVLTPEQAANLQFQPNANLNGNPGPVTFAVTDNRGAESSTGTINILLLPVPDAPVSSADFASSPEDTALTLAPAALLANDVDVDGDTLTITSVQNASNGSVALVGGNVVFTPPPNYSGPASFTYTVSDGSGGTSTATVFITVTSVNDAPVANNDAGSTLLNTSIGFPASTLLSNDSDIDGGPLNIVSVQNPVNGTVSIVNGTPVFDPTPGYVGPASFTYTISDGNGGSATATVNINVTAPPPPPPPPPAPPPPAVNGLSINDVTVNESAGTATFTVTLAPAATSVVTVNFTTSSGTATSGTDFSATTGLLTFPVGVTTRTITVPITNDLLAEGSESFNVTLSGAVNASIANGTGVGTIVDNDGVPSIASISSPTTTEGNNLVFAVTVSGTSSTNTSIPFTLGGGSASTGDYTTPTFSNGVTLVGTNLVIPAGVTSFSVTLPTVNDTVTEPSEAVPLTIGGVTGTGTITDNDGAPSIASISSPTVLEGNDLVYAVVVSGTSSTNTSIPFTLGGGSASTGDYTTPTFSNGVTLVGTNLVIPAGVTSFSVTLPTVNDTVTEPSEAVPLTIGGVTGTGTITDNDPAPTVASVASDTKVEGTSLSHLVTLTGTTTAPLTVAFSVAGVTASAGDFGAPTFGGGVVNNGDGTITIPVGVSSFSVTIPTVNDTVNEPSETLTLTVGGASGTGTITDNDGVPSIASISSPTVLEGNDLVYAVTVSGTSSTNTSIPFTLGGGSASTGDYTTPTFSNGVTLVGTNLVIPAGVTSFSVTLPTVNDTVTEPSEAVPLTIGGVTGTGTITDNDGAPSIASISSPTVVEGNDLVYAVTVSGTSSTNTSIPFTLGGGSASTGDYTTATFSNGVTLVAGNVVIPPGVTSFSVTLPTVNDTTNESNETVPLVIGGVTGTGTITDNDARSVTKITLEDTTATFTAADFGLVAGDTGVRIDTTAPGAGQLLLNGAAVSAGTVVSRADIDAGLLTYSPAGNGPTSTNLSGNNYASFTFSVRDASNVFDLVTNNVRIDVTPDADAPTISVAPATVTPPLPVSQGLTWQFTPNLPGADSSNAGNTALVESAIDAAGGASSLVTNVFLSGSSFPNGVGSPAGLGSEPGGQNDPAITSADNAHQFTGFVFLEAGQTATFSGFRDDTMRIELGGTTVLDSGFNNWGPFSSTGFTAAATGFYSVEIVYYNGDGPGGLNVNFSTGGAAQDLSTSNFVLLPNAAAVTALGSGVVGSLVANGEPGAGYYPANFTSSTWVDLATTVNFPDTDGSETRNISVTGLPAGFELRDGVNTVTSTGGAINITTWNLANLEARPAAGYTGTATLTFTATATEQGNSDTASSTDTVTLTVTPTTVSALDAPLSGPVIAKTAFDTTTDEPATAKTHAEVFEWHLSDSAANDQHPGPSIDVINDFQVQADSLDLRDLLVGESHLGQDLGNLANFLSVNVVGGDTEIRISSTGGFEDGQYNSAAEDQRIVLDNVDLVASLSLTPESSNHDIITAMLNNGKLITD
jgi:hypothetical protein